MTFPREFNSPNGLKGMHIYIYTPSSPERSSRYRKTLVNAPGAVLT